MRRPPCRRRTSPEPAPTCSALPKGYCLCEPRFHAIHHAGDCFPTGHAQQMQGPLSLTYLDLSVSIPLQYSEKGQLTSEHRQIFIC